ncbi:MAG: hypothetical protein Q7R35_00920 [Elusimicrobiota bacterium]|nr:hypothetical protein [Elusimicrobiota bacterium]
MKLIFKLAAVALLHLVFFACYPETGQFGNYYLAISLLLWVVFMLFISTSTKLVSLFSGAAGLAINLAAFGLMALALAATMPQGDKTSVLTKLQEKKYPDRDTISAGLERFGINLPREAKAGRKALEKEMENAVKKAEEKIAK